MFADRILSGDQLKILHPYDGWRMKVYNDNTPTSLSDNTSVDFSLHGLATLLLKPRVDEELEDWLGITFLKVSDYASINDFDDADNLFNSLGVPGGLRFIDVHGDVFDNFTPPEGWQSLDDISLFFQDRDVYVKVFLNEEAETTYVIVQDLRITIWHTLGAIFPRFVPWIFKNKPLTSEERELLSSMRERTPDRFLSLAAKITDNLFDFREQIIRNTIGGYMGRYAEERRNQINYRINDLYSRISAREEDLMKLRREVFEQSSILAGVNSLQQEDEADLIDFMIRSGNVDIIHSEGSAITFGITSPLTNYDREDAEIIINNEHSYLYNHLYDWSISDAMEFLDAIFVQERFRVKMYAEFKADFVYNSVQGLRFNTRPERSDCVPNMHIKLHACLGNNGEQIMNAMAANNHIGAINAMIASTANINIQEAASNEEFFKFLFNTTNPVIIMEDGRQVSPKEAFENL